MVGNIDEAIAKAEKNERLKPLRICRGVLSHLYPIYLPHFDTNIWYLGRFQVSGSRFQVKIFRNLDYSIKELKKNQLK